MKMRLLSILVVAASLLGAWPAMAQCSNVYSLRRPAVTEEVSYSITILAGNSNEAEWVNAVHSAIADMNQCFGAGEDGPNIVHTNDSGTADIRFIIEPGPASNRDMPDEYCGFADMAGRDPIHLFTNGVVGGPCNIERTSVHELMHWFGARHSEISCGSAYTMYPYDNDDWERIQIEECDSLRELWPDPGRDDEPRPISPLVLDLDDNGIHTSSVHYDPVTFDLDADGTPEQVGWLARDSLDAFLWLDLNRDGVPNSGAELFGDYSSLPGGQTATNGMEALAAYDENKDGKINADDAVWARLLLWNDRDHSGTFSQNERENVSTSKVVGISLKYSPRNWMDENGNMHTHKTAYWTRQGRNFARHAMEDIWFLVQPTAKARSR